MGLMKRIFGAGDRAPATSRTSGFRDSIATTELGPSRNAPRRELVQVVLRDTMRKHGIPTDWIDCRILSVVTHQHKPGMHVQFVVRHGDEQLLPYLHAFQASFWQEIERFEPKVKQWLFSVGWEFHVEPGRGFSPMPNPSAWAAQTQRSKAGDTLPPGYDDAESMESDLKALQAAMAQPAAEPVEWAPTTIGPDRVP
jgi:hypothetical protein